ncbi:hypothetical protein [Smaragdicoccus niigatensis]|uniref:hypothetical protein n=1 Tax=Smaragdicoccus niigatensis TaxID=359359 RepID=UPI0012DD5FE0|nr:hypothetical protein [Smaragdicoccus niigatensis]
MRPHRLAVVPILTAVITFGVACSSEPVSQSGGQPAGAARESGEVSPTAGKWTEPCSLLTADEISPLIDSTAAGTPSGDSQHGAACEWRNSDTYESVSLNIGSPDTAINDVVPDDPSGAYTFEDGPDGIKFTNAGTAMFVLDKRLCEIQVTTLRSADNAHDKYVELIGKIRSRF